MDLAPTMLELAGVPWDEGMDGRSLLPLLHQPDARLAPQPLLFTNMPGDGALRESMFTLVRRARVLPGRRPMACKVHQLYDLHADPHGVYGVFRFPVGESLVS
jgi:arylsulfatase A-like enzyme